MANSYWKSFPEGKSTPAPSYEARAGSSAPNMPRKQSFTSMSLPGKASNNFAAAKRGFKEVNGYAAYKGLSKSAKKPSRPFADFYDSQSQMKMGEAIVKQAIRNKNVGYKVPTNKYGPKIDLDIINDVYSDE